jgi:hypothetical protein
VPVTWASTVTDYASDKIDRLEYLRLWTAEMRANYRKAYASVRVGR